VRLISIDLSLLRTEIDDIGLAMAVARRDEGGLKPLRMEVEQSRKRFLPDISSFRTFLERSVTRPP